MVEATGIFDCKIRLFSKSYSEPPEVSFLLGFKIAIDAWGFTCGDISSWWLSSLSLILSQKQNKNRKRIKFTSNFILTYTFTGFP